MANDVKEGTAARLNAARLKIYLWLALCCWTLLIAGSFACFCLLSEKQVLSVSRVKAVTAFERDRIFRYWVSRQGGIYAPVSSGVRPDPLLGPVPDREITTPSGKRLTLISANQMTRLAFEDADPAQLKSAGTSILTSLTPLNPGNKPDAWERRALLAFRQGAQEVSGVETVNGRPYMRLLRAAVASEPCRACHSGLAPGELRGGVGVSVPIGDILEATRPQVVGAACLYGLIWLLGLGLIAAGGRRLSLSVLALEESDRALREQAAQLSREITERQGAQLDLAAKQRELEQLNRCLEARVAEEVGKNREKDQILIVQNRQAAMGEMIGNIAHQWRQPLNALGILLANIKDAYYFHELDAACLERSVADGDRLVRKMSMTIDDFRNFFHPVKDGSVFWAGKQVNEAIELVRSSFGNDRVKIEVLVARDLRLFGFPNEYSQVLLNLLSNAREAILASGREGGRIRIGIGECAGQGRVTVSDDGGGIAPQHLDRIFDPYFSTKQMGTGIGLYMSKMIIERNMHGSLSARNLEGGAEFTVSTPLAPWPDESAKERP